MALNKKLDIHSHILPKEWPDLKQVNTTGKGRAIKGLVVFRSIARINDLWVGSMEKRKVRGLVPCCGQDGYRAQVPKHP